VAPESPKCCVFRRTSARRTLENFAPILLGNECLRENKILNQERVNIMSIEKKSLLSTLKSTKKANVIKDEISVDAMSRNAGAKAQPG